MRMKIIVLSLVLIAVLGGIATGAVTVPDVLGDSMVLQRDVKVPVWGKAEPGETVVVTFQKQKLTVVADRAGKWRVDLKPLRESSVPAELTIEGSNKIVFRDVLVGEVWLVSGQSNMQWTLFQSNDGEREVAAADHPQIRLFNVSREVGFKKKSGKLGEWATCNPKSVRDFSGAGFYFARELQKTLKVPVGVINSSYGGSQAEAWTPLEYLIDHPDLKATVERTKIWEEERSRVRARYDAEIEAWKIKAEEQKAQGARPSPSPSVPDALRDYRIAASIYNGMIEPLIPFAIRGAVWYQGESNEARAEQYRILLPTMIRAWREKWGQGDFPFGVIQLPNYRRVSEVPEESSWSFIREAQRVTAEATKNTGLIVTIDIGEANDIHPRNKLDVGLRMHRWAMRAAYRAKIALQPRFRSAKIERNRMILTFEDAGGGLRISRGEKLSEFAIAGDDRKFVWAEARIIGRNKIEVSAAGIANPRAVRYAFNANPKNPNLTNDSGIPASPFRTDNWPDPTTGKR